MKRNGSTKLVPAWQRRGAQTVAHATGLFYPTGGTAVYDADPYDCVLRTNAGRLATYATGEMSIAECSWRAAILLREAALLLDLLQDRQHAREEAKEAQKARGKAARS